MDSVLELFDFSAKFDRGPELPPIPDNTFDSRVNSAVARAEDATTAGNLSRLAKALSDLRSLLGPNASFDRLSSTLSLVTRHGHREVLKYLLAENVPITADAVTAAKVAKDEWMLDLMLSSGWNIDEPLGLTTPSALALAVEDRALVSWFLERGASPNAQCSLDLTPLSIAVQFSSMSIIQSLFDYGGSVQYGQVVHYAVRRDLPDQHDVLDFILSKNPPINHIMYQEHPQSYFRQRMFGLGTQLHEAAGKGKLEMVKKLIDLGTHPLIRDSCGKIPLQRAQKAGEDSIVVYLGRITAIAEWPVHQFTNGKETTSWS
ncbi:hypothetical protein KC343_g1238 [Hortaea werneckii]|uniref:Uncharacterized protein n=1 Tax=Hortaea werneckii TaxID=91943 RepID=A0A3M7H9M6_HORWE|nr:hypothetical protein KC352_g6347 [Hortaea werneckii]KAI7571710.1 hypothetical protein KC317_g1398 [Hortaea werneckii]KAI7626617.1 hypothetical protein KC346_g1169 [Hortaea werneckii]KAI7636540.1 hypothetical protein KC343_g1238 [Hortaea werneckii]KAI7682167.1 hypothetical protein KC319_g1160 [Hortaea werneckii]